MRTLLRLESLGERNTPATVSGHDVHDLARDVHGDMERVLHCDILEHIDHVSLRPATMGTFKVADGGHIVHLHNVHAGLIIDVDGVTIDPDDGDAEIFVPHGAMLEARDGNETIRFDPETTGEETVVVQECDHEAHHHLGHAIAEFAEAQEHANHARHDHGQEQHADIHVHTHVQEEHEHFHTHAHDRHEHHEHHHEHEGEDHEKKHEEGHSEKHTEKRASEQMSRTYDAEMLFRSHMSHTHDSGGVAAQEPAALADEEGDPHVPTEQSQPSSPHEKIMSSDGQLPSTERDQQSSRNVIYRASMMTLAAAVISTGLTRWHRLRRRNTVS